MMALACQFRAARGQMTADNAIYAVPKKPHKS
jgi:hypothetical protein